MLKQENAYLYTNKLFAVVVFSLLLSKWYYTINL